MQYLSLCVSIGTALLLASSYSRSEPHDRSVLDLIFSLAISAFVLFATQRFYPSFLSSPTETDDRYVSIPLGEFKDPEQPVQSKSRTFSNASTQGNLGYRRQIGLLLLASVALTIRVELYRAITATAQCASRSVAVFMPLVLALNECRYQQKAQSSSEEIADKDVRGILSRIPLLLLQSKWRYVPSASLLAYGCYTMTILWQPQTTTFICPVVSGETASIPRFQRLALVIDCLLAVILQELVKSNKSSRQQPISLLLSCAAVLLGTVFCWTISTFVLYTAGEALEWLLVHDTTSTAAPLWLMLGRGLLSSIFVLCAIKCIYGYGAYKYSVILTAFVTLFLGATELWSTRYTFFPHVPTMIILSLTFIHVGGWSTYRVTQAIGQAQPSRFLLRQLLSFIVLLFLFLPGLWPDEGVRFHPVEQLMSNAKSQHQGYIKYASHSTDLGSAISVYRERYKSEPPPGFDVWYEYAQNRSVLIIDDFDQIYRDILPFRNIAPADIRRNTWEAVSNPWNEISGISIRNGKADVQENVLPTHRWMLEGVAILINAFAQYLPDMDLAFNLNDESRVAVPYNQITNHRNAAGLKKLNGKSSWSVDRASTWQTVAKEAYQKTIFENFSFQKNFHRFGSAGCSPNSLAITQPYLSSQTHLCLQCFEPHSLGQFVSNWTLAADMCHQPDMSHLHGFYLSPAAFKTTRELMPIFSQSKASGYNDILYPSSWNYMDKVIYKPVKSSGEHGSDTYSAGYPDPPFADKENTLYWRGATSEGVSGGTHAWRGMNRQRLIHLVNNATSNSYHDHVTLLLPDAQRPGRYTYQSFPGSALMGLGLQKFTDIKIAPEIVRCGGVDCPDQAKEFGLVTPSDFQAHWRYKFLFDMDGAGFSGRFLPFLQSRSLPFKTALFREWYDSRITAWRHFVPIDLRLHGVWSTLAYFAGVDGVWPGTNKKFVWEAHTQEAEIIAEEGRKWAGQVLRKEDMEVYFFRLLLEWGRLTDDRRDELGYAMS